MGVGLVGQDVDQFSRVEATYSWSRSKGDFQKNSSSLVIIFAFGAWGLTSY